MFCSERWWQQHLGQVPEGVQRWSSEMQRKRLTEIDAYFHDVPELLDANAMRYMESKKHSHAESRDCELAKLKFRKEMLKKQIRELETKLGEETMRRAEAEIEASRAKLARLCAEDEVGGTLC